VITTQIPHHLCSGDVVRLDGVDGPSAELFVEVVSESQFYAMPTGSGSAELAGSPASFDRVRMLRKFGEADLTYVSNL
jgi:hypothetical protein